ncbi:ArsR/SmtB family transcription factor [Enterococcus devriesei]|uniref:ArsR family transcriptional regulator n=1 Tax=Enterococcus devriesei TaxID=319970 RepID=A0A1L8STX1_9ENTE|nr:MULTISPECIES: metalloregulator ArsR/SmtB family transcription factor [Enterococcus]MBU5365595.1 metalloregulator ArsR/SmtB family transcription factor [Enterococcus devriesei]MDT2822628.1 metalloregulator ArsR/SmtB family transcription factor [Enterococcus devriesei]OJG35511.1 ArsR family transcriptional regulator [Enterococcus devriesei]
MKAKYDPEKCRQLIQDSVDIDFFRAICDPVRSELLIFLASTGELSIGEIAENFPQNRSGISRHLDYMNRFGAVHRRKEGREVYYRVDKEQIANKFESASDNMKALLNQI